MTGEPAAGTVPAWRLWRWGVSRLLASVDLLERWHRKGWLPDGEATVGISEAVTRLDHLLKQVGRERSKGRD